jgi:prophage antirepressor-like protein
MKVRRQRRPRFVGTEASRIIGYALSGVAQELSRLMARHLARRRRALTRRGQTGRISKRDVFRLLCRAFPRAILNPRGDAARAAKHRSALIFALAAADVPPTLRVSGMPTEIRHARKRRRK